MSPGSLRVNPGNTTAQESFSRQAHASPDRGVTTEGGLAIEFLSDVHSIAILSIADESVADIANRPSCPSSDVRDLRGGRSFGNVVKAALNSIAG